jgi:hypothetical protein
MATLDTDVHTLFKLFPKQLSNLDVVTKTNKGRDLNIFYVQKHTEDPFRNWERYAEWTALNREYMLQQEGLCKTHLPLPKEIDPIYPRSLNYVDSGLISRTDRILLIARFRIDTEIKDDVVYFSEIQRNKGRDLQGVGGGFYTNARNWLKGQGFNYIKGFPASNALQAYWAQQGMIPISSLPADKKEYVSTPNNNREGTFVDILI